MASRSDVTFVTLILVTGFLFVWREKKGKLSPNGLEQHQMANGISTLFFVLVLFFCPMIQIGTFGTLAASGGCRNPNSLTLF